jgi:hypothetical protein
MNTPAVGATPGILTTDCPQVWYRLPVAGQAAKARILEMLHSPRETWIKAFNFSLGELFAEIEAASKEGVVIHALIDHTQECGPSEKTAVVELAKACPNCEFIVSTAGPDSDHPGYILHDKAIVVAPELGFEYECWTGSVNFSAMGFSQANTACYFRSNDWGQDFVDDFNRNKAWALANEKQYQLVTAA